MCPLQFKVCDTVGTSFIHSFVEEMLWYVDRALSPAVMCWVHIRTDVFMLQLSFWGSGETDPQVIAAAG